MSAVVVSFGIGILIGFFIGRACRYGVHEIVED